MENVMGVVKKNMVSIICGVIVLLAILAIFWPISGMFDDLRGRASSRVSVYNQIRELVTKDRKLPVVALKEGAEAPKLTQFPTQAQIAHGQEVKTKIEAEAKAIQEAAVKLNRGDKDLLFAGALPQPKNQTAGNNFARKYAEEMDYASADPARRAQSMPFREMKAGMKPTDAEIKAAQDANANAIKRDELQVDAKGKPTNEAQVNAKIAAENAEIPSRMYAEVANNSKVYVDPGSFDVVERVVNTGGRAPLLPDMFWAQVGYWLQRDVCRAIAEANAGATNVQDAVVKRVVKIDLPEPTPQQPHGFTVPPAAAVDPNDPNAAAAPVPTDPSQPITKNFTVSPTGRYSNPLYDVVQFKLQLVVDAQKVPLVLQMLSKNRFITVYQTNITVVDSAAEQLNGYFYGPRPVVQLDMDCEALFLREWTRQFMPAIVKQRLGVTDPAPATPPA
jgi:hypothetical protein